MCMRITERERGACVNMQYNSVHTENVTQSLVLTGVAPPVGYEPVIFFFLCLLNMKN